MFIVFEGLDKSGKSTSCNAVYSKLKNLNLPTVKMHFPDRNTVIGDILNKYLTGKLDLTPEATQLLFTADRYEKRDFIEKTASSHILLCDRYSWSGICFSYAKGLDLDWCVETERLLPKPDITFYLEADVEILMKRHNWGDEILETRDFQYKAADGYGQMKDFVDNVVVIDAEKSVEEISEIVVQEILKLKSRREQIEN
ncbi:thymidylate kinase [Vairimorpha necatrix]|uniref:dTMP kinase n=1 Tax=Vairimorpha necatrix TaxID=6039 RepID=A0AAX4JEX7_9MICR